MIESRAVVLVAQKNGLVLATSRKDNHADFGLPGGKVEKGEAPMEALRREIKEETGLLITKAEYKADAMDGDTKVYIFLGEVSGNIHTEENIVVKWAEWADLFKGSFGEFNKAFYDKYIK